MTISATNGERLPSAASARQELEEADVDAADQRHAVAVAAASVGKTAPHGGVVVVVAVRWACRASAKNLADRSEAGPTTAFCCVAHPMPQGKGDNQELGASKTHTHANKPRKKEKVGVWDRFRFAKFMH